MIFVRIALNSSEEVSSLAYLLKKVEFTPCRRKVIFQSGIFMTDSFIFLDAPLDEINDLF